MAAEAAAAAEVAGPGNGVSEEQSHQSQSLRRRRGSAVTVRSELTEHEDSNFAMAVSGSNAPLPVFGSRLNGFLQDL